MKHTLLLASCLAAAVAAADVSLGQLPECGYADTETSTNVPLAFARAGVKNFDFELCLVGTPSNNVQLAFGRDQDSDGVLAADETDMAVGWDCGGWRIVNCETGDAVESAAATTNDVKALSWSLFLRRGRPRRLAVSENGVPVFAELADAPEPWFHSPGWDMLRLTVRGVDAAYECARIKLVVSGCVIDLR